MINVKHTQKRIENIVSVYRLAFPNEYKTACEGVIMQREMQTDELGTLNVELSGAAPQRALYEIPENLFNALLKQLDEEELTYWKTKEGARWFIKAAPEFSLTR